MSREKIIKKLKIKNPNINHPEILETIEVFCDSIKSALKENKKIELRNFGTFFIKEIKEKHSARNPKTGELIYVPGKNKIRFKASKHLNKKINE